MSSRNDEPRANKPAQSAWQEAQRAVADRNDKARKEAQAARAVHEKRIEQQRAERERARGIVYR